MKKIIRFLFLPIVLPFMVIAWAFSHFKFQTFWDAYFDE